MRSPLAAVLVAVVSSLATVAALELWRNGRSSAAEPAAPERRERSAAHEPRAADALVPPPTGAPDAGDERLAELERRVTALELGASARRSAAAPEEGALPPEEALREQVLAWIAEEREARARTAALDGEEKHRAELEFAARHQAMTFAQEHGLERWQEDEFAKLFLETGVRADEIERAVDLARDTPEEVEARWTEFDAWVERRERELTARVDPELYAKIYGDGDG